MSAGAIGNPWSVPWGAVGEAAKDTASAGARTSPVGALLGLLLYPTSLNEGENERMAQVHHDWQEAQARAKAKGTTKDVATSRTCNPTQDKSCKQDNEHRGVIQAQEGSNMLVPGANWGPQPLPPSYTHCKTLLYGLFST